ncbi:hypothetical protein [Nocardia sp. NPDC004604]|uniref:hypothetical protein n=1 Tax=Nocardia sp. NPDC004604 TaxID=3157013 RepID=UPI0033A42832
MAGLAFVDEHPRDPAAVDGLDNRLGNRVDVAGRAETELPLVDPARVGRQVRAATELGAQQNHRAGRVERGADTGFRRIELEHGRIRPLLQIYADGGDDLALGVGALRGVVDGFQGLNQLLAQGRQFRDGIDGVAVYGLQRADVLACALHGGRALGGHRPDRTRHQVVAIWPGSLVEIAEPQRRREDRRVDRVHP